MRISAFVSPDDKKPLQRSIIGFLQPGKTDSSGSVQGMHQKPEKDHHVQTWTLARPPLTQKCQKQEEVSWRSKLRGLEGGQTSEEPQQSFFQRAHAKRLQLQAANAIPQEEGHRENDSVIESIGSHAQNCVESSAKNRKSIASDLLENDFVSCEEAQASTSGCGGTVSESLTCPVCFRQVETTDLNVFNGHIDQCLSESSRKPNQSTDLNSESDLDSENDHKECQVVEKWREECEVEEEKVKNSEELELKRTDPQNQRSLKNDSHQKVVSINGDDKTVTSQQPQSCNGRGPVLICPVCQLTQDTDDLAIFNHHVDLCLNQEVLHELGGQTSCPINPLSVTNGKAIGECVH